MKRTKYDLRELGKLAGLDYVDSEVVGGQTVYLFQDKPDPLKYVFRLFVFINDDLTEENMKLCKKIGYSRDIEVTL